MTLLSLQKDILSDAILQRLLEDNPRINLLDVTRTEGLICPSLGAAQRLGRLFAMHAKMDHIDIEGILFSLSLSLSLSLSHSLSLINVHSL